jgi:hypothetical protein
MLTLSQVSKSRPGAPHVVGEPEGVVRAFVVSHPLNQKTIQGWGTGVLWRNWRFGAGFGGFPPFPR